MANEDDDFSPLNDHYSQPILIKAHRIKDLVKPDPEHPGIFKAPGSGGTMYRLQVTESGGPTGDVDLPFVTCSCPNGMARGGRPSCYHSAAVLLYLEKQARDFHPEADFSELLDRVRARIE